MTRLEASKLGGLAFGLKSRKEALERYYIDPNRCLSCGVIIIVRAKQSAAEARKKKFCSKSCAATYNNTLYPKRKAVSSGPCERCGVEVTYTKRKDRRRGGYRQVRFCKECGSLVRRQNQSKNGKLLCDRTKDEVFSEAKTSWHARNAITWDARRSYNRSGRPKVCATCGYSRHTQVCHKRPVSQFSGDTLVSEINSLENLVPLCPTHHWELDHGFLEL
jgi:hypothetical protein